MILTFAPNPALERVALVEEFSPGAAQKPMRVSTYAGGAGLRAANVIRLLGGDVLALAFVGGALGELLRDCLDRQDIPHILTVTQADTRGDFLLLDKEKGVITEIPERPAPPSSTEQERLMSSLTRHIENARLLVIADGQEGSDPALFERAIATAKAANVPVLADLCGPALGAAMAGGVWLLRVNLLTLQKWTERSLQNDRAVVEEAQAMIANGVENVVVTLGEEGALYVNAGGAWRVKAPVVSHFNPTGSGETLSGALAVRWNENGGDVLDAVRYGCAAASVNVTHDEPGYATPGEVGVLYPRTVATPVVLR